MRQRGIKKEKCACAHPRGNRHFRDADDLIRLVWHARAQLDRDLALRHRHARRVWQCKRSMLSRPVVASAHLGVRRLFRLAAPHGDKAQMQASPIVPAEGGARRQAFRADVSYVQPPRDDPLLLVHCLFGLSGRRQRPWWKKRCRHPGGRVVHVGWHDDHDCSGALGESRARSRS